MTQFFRKIYLSLYLKGLCVRGSWRPNRTATYWPPHSIGHNRVSFPFSWAAQLEAWGPSLSRCWFSLPHLMSNSSDPQTHSGVPRAPSAGCCFLYSIIFQLWLNFLCPELYNSSTPSQSLPINGQWNISLPPSLEWHVLIIIEWK